MLITLQKNIITGFQKSHSHETALLCPLLYNAETFLRRFLTKFHMKLPYKMGKSKQEFVCACLLDTPKTALTTETP